MNGAVITPAQAERVEAMSAMLAAPDPPDLPPRRKRYRCGGAWWKRDAIKAQLARAYVAHRLLEYRGVR